MATPRKPKDKYEKLGRPGEWNDRFVGMAYDHCLLGATDESLSHLLGITVETLHKWKREHPDFSESIRNGKEGADESVAKAMYHRAKGITRKIIRTKPDGSQETTIEELPPDPTCALFWLKNRHGKFWREKQEVDSNVHTSVSFTFQEVEKKD